MTFEFTEKYTYAYLNLLKKSNAKFNPDTKTWSIPLQFKRVFFEQKKHLDDENKIKIQSLWLEACDDLGYKFVKKGTNEYLEVMSVFKAKLKN